MIFSNGNSTIQIILSSFYDNIADNDGGVMSLQNQTNTTLDSCTFTRSLAHSHGGSIGIEYSHVRILNCMFCLSVAERGGGVIRAINSTIEICNSSFNANNASAEGGIIYAHTESTVLIKDSDFLDNTAVSFGGVLRLEQSNTNITGSRFENNTALQRGGAISAKSSEIFIAGKTTFCQNIAHSYGGAIDMEISNITILNGSDDYEYEVNINNNTASQGGGISVFGSKLYIRASTNIGYNTAFENDTDDNYGGALYAQDTLISFGSTLEFFHNQATFGGAVFLSNSTFEDGILADENRSYEVTFASNHAADSGGTLFVYDNNCFFVSGVPPCFFQKLRHLPL